MSVLRKQLSIVLVLHACRVLSMCHQMSHKMGVVTLHAQHEWGKVIGVGVHKCVCIYNIC